MALTTIKNLNLTSSVTGTLPVANGGTGLASGTTDQILKFTGTTTLASAAEAAGGKVLQCLSYTQGAATVTSSTSYVNFSSMLVTITPSAPVNPSRDVSHVDAFHVPAPQPYP